MNTLKVKIDALKGKSAFSCCRKLIKEGVDPSIRLEVYRDSEEWDFAIPNIGEGARLMVVDSDRDGLYITEYHKPLGKART